MRIDMHVHIGYALGWDMTEDMVLESMERYNIDYSIVSNTESVRYDHNFKEVPKEMQHTRMESLKRSIDFARKYPDKIGVMPWIKPESERLNGEFKQYIVDNLDIIYGIKMHPYHSHLAFDSNNLYEYLDLAEELHLPVLIHTGGCDEASPERVYNMALKYPKVNFIMGHMELGTDNENAINYISKLPNLYGDTAWVSIESVIKAIKTFGSEKILFGSDNPIDGVDTYHHNPKGEPSLYQQYFNDLKDMISKEDYDNIMYKNSIKLFNLHNILKLK